MVLYCAPKWRHWKPYTGPKSPSSLCASPLLSRNSREPLPSQMRTPLSCSSFAEVPPAMNHSSSSATPRQNTRFVVSSGNTLSRRLHRELTPNFEMVPTPVRSPRTTPEPRMSRMARRYCSSSCSRRAGAAGKGRAQRARPCSARWRYTANWKGTPFCSWRGASSSSAYAASSTGGMATSQGTSASTRVRNTVSHTTPGAPASASAKAAAPPITKAAATDAACGGADSSASAAASEGATSTSGGSAADARTAASSPRDSTTFKRPRSGRNFSGMLDHVRRPMITALQRAGTPPPPPPGTSVVMRLKYAMSAGRSQGNLPSFPMPPLGVAATMREHVRDIVCCEAAVAPPKTPPQRRRV